VNFNASPMGVKGSAMPIAQMMRLVVISAGLARLCRKGIFAVRMMWMMSVCVSRDSTNQPVWNSDGLFQQSKRHCHIEQVEAVFHRGEAS
jgi:hypothetical protein